MSTCPACKHDGAAASAVVGAANHRDGAGSRGIRDALRGRVTEQSQKADDLFHKGKVLYQATRVREAHDAYAAAWGLKHSYDIAANLANTEMLLGMKRDAAEHWAECARNFPPSGNKAQLDAIKARFDDARKEVGALFVKGLAPGAAMRIDGKELGKGPFADELYVEPGKHVVEVKHAGYEDTKQTFDVEAGGSASVELTQKKIKAARPVALHPVRPLPPSLPSGPSTPLVVGGAAISFAALGTGVAFFAIASGKGSDADRMVFPTDSYCAKPPTPGACRELLSLRQDQLKFQNAGVALFVGGSVIAASTLVYALWPRGKQAPKNAWVVPVVGTGGAGVWLHGTF